MAKKIKKLSNKKKAEITQSEAYVTITSREVAEMTGKRHADVLRDIDKIARQIILVAPDFIRESSYTDSQNKKRRIIEMSNSVAFTIMSQYSPQLAYSVAIEHRDQITQDILSNGYSRKQRFEPVVISVLEQALGVELVRQFHVCVRGKNYYVDAYDPINNIAYEVDERHHQIAWHRLIDKQREKAIESVLECEFVRIDIGDFA